jgi:hypothetical protein
MRCPSEYTVEAQKLHHKWVFLGLGSPLSLVFLGLGSCLVFGLSWYWVALFIKATKFWTKSNSNFLCESYK